MTITDQRLSDNASDVAPLLGAAADDWRDQALCAQTDPESFFPEKGGSPREAKQVCQSCNVRDECLNAALENDERFGVWGGLSERERRKLKRSPTAHSDSPKEIDADQTHSAEAAASVHHPEGTAA